MFHHSPQFGKSVVKTLLESWRGVLCSFAKCILIGFPIMIGIVGLAHSAGLLPDIGLKGRHLWLGTGHVLLAGAMSFVAWALEDLIRHFRPRITGRRESKLSKIEPASVLKGELERVIRGSQRVRVLDVTGITRHLATLKEFPGTGVAPTHSYQQITIAHHKRQIEAVVDLASRSEFANSVSHIFAHGDRFYLSSFSFCLIERASGLYAFIFHDLGGGESISIEICDAAFGHFLLEEFSRYWDYLASPEKLLLDKGRLNKERVRVLLRECSGDSVDSGEEG